MERRSILVLILSLVAGFIGPPSSAAQVKEQAAQQTAGGWFDLLKSPDPKIREKAAHEIGKSGESSAVPALAGALHDTDPKVRREVVMALFQIRQPASLDALLTATRDSDPGVRAVAVQAVVGYYTGVAPTAGFTGFVKKQYRRAKGHFEADTARIDPGVNVDPKVVTALVAAMQDTGSIQAAREAAKGLGTLMAQSAVPNLVQSAHSTDEELARESLNALAKIKDRSAGPQLVSLLDSPDKDIKRDAAVTVGILRARDAVPKLQSIFENDPDKKDKEKALEGLSYLGDPVSVPIFTKALWSERKELRTSAAEGLARAGDSKMAPEVEKALKFEKDAGARLAMEFALAALGKDDYLDSVVQELGSRMRGDVAQAYLVELTRDKKFLAKLYSYLNNQDADVRRKLCTVLMYTGDQTSLAHLERLSHDSNGDVASEALRALRAVRARGTSSSALLHLEIG